MLNREYSISTNKGHLTKENARITQVLKENGYQESITNNNSLPQSQQHAQATDIQEDEIEISIHLRYIEGTGEKLRCRLRSHKTRSLSTLKALCVTETTL